MGVWVCTNSRDNLFRQFRFLSRRYFRATVQVLLWEVGWSTVVFYLDLLPWNCILTGCNWLMEKRYFNSCEIKRMKEWIKCVPKHRHVRKRASKSLCIKPKTIKSRRFKDSTGKSTAVRSYQAAWIIKYGWIPKWPYVLSHCCHTPIFCRNLQTFSPQISFFCRILLVGVLKFGVTNVSRGNIWKLSTTA